MDEPTNRQDASRPKRTRAGSARFYALLAVLLLTVAVPARPAPAGQGPGAGGAAAYQPLRDFSGFEIVGRHIRLPADRSLRAICQTKLRASEDALAAAEGSLAAETDPVKLVRLHQSAAQVYLYRGDLARAAERFEAALRIVTEHQGNDPDLQAEGLFVEEALGVTHLRRGEIENCALNHNAAMCIFPLAAAAQHKLPSGSEKAIEHFERYLTRDPGNLEVRWLLNVAYMTLGGYPAKVPKEHLIPPSAFESKEDIGRFVDAAPSVGLDVVGNAGGAIVDDFTNDGLLDVVMSGVDACLPMRFFRNNGDGTFADATAQAKLADQLGAINLTQADYDNDGWLDVYVMRGGWEFPMPNSLLRNNRDGSFTDVTAESGLATVEHRTQSAAWGDFDNDGWVDLYVGHEQTPSQLFRNRGDGTFVDVSRSAHVDLTAYTKGVVWGDYDNDGFPDLYASNYLGENFLYHNNGDGTFDEVASDLRVEKPIRSFPTWFFDYDNDGLLDLFVSNYSFSVVDMVREFLGQPRQEETMKLYQNTGKGGFEDVTTRVGLDRSVASMGSNFGDLDNDGWLDFYLGTGTPSYAALMPNRMFRNHDGKYFVDVTSSTGTGHLQKGHGVAFSDVDNDGDQDIYANIGGAIIGDKYNKVLFENPGHGNNWISVRLVGTKSNRAAIGAKIKLTLAGGGQQGAIRYREVTSGGSYGSSTLAQQIGLGKSSRIETLEVWWPASNTRQTFKNVDANQFIEIKELDTKFTRRPLKPFALARGKKPHVHAGHSK